jgi:hypothetical protein
MIVDYLDIIHTVSLPAEADAPLVVDSNAVLAFAIATECFQLIARGMRSVLSSPALLSC